MASDFSKHLAQDIEGILCDMGLFLAQEVPREQVQHWLAHGLEKAQALQSAAAVKRLPHIEAYAAQLQQLFQEAQQAPEQDSYLMLQLGLDPIQHSFRHSVTLLQNTRPPSPKSLKRLSYAVETLYDLDPHPGNTQSSDAVTTPTTTTDKIPLTLVLKSFLPWIQQTANTCGKAVEVTFDIEPGLYLGGRATHAVQTILVHLLKNALTHGIEPTWTRKALGKPSIGQLRLSATLDGDELILKITDDGAGIGDSHPSRTLETAGTGRDASVSENTALETSVYAANNAHPGLGVGLHIVESQTNRLDGIFILGSAPEQGTTAELRLPRSILQ